MLATVRELELFSGVYRSGDDYVTLQQMYINSATSKINRYLGYDVEEKWEDISEADRDQVKNVCLEIATLLQMEEDGNIGVNSQSFASNGSRTFLNVTDFSKYLKNLSHLRGGYSLEM